MIVTVIPGTLSGSLQAPASKSAMQRACAAALVAAGRTLIHNPGHSNDDKAALDIIQRLGATVTSHGDHLEVVSNGVKPRQNEIHCGESGLSIRMFTPLAALSEQELTLTGSGSLVTRPMDFFDRILPELGVYVHSQQGRLPLVIKGPLSPANITIDGSLSSQFLTGLLLAFSASDARDITIRVNDLKSKPYIGLTLGVMKQFGLKVPENRDFEAFYFDRAAHEGNRQRSFTVEGDWSGGAFLLVAGVLAGPLTVKGLDIHSEQADKAMLQALLRSGANLNVKQDRIELRQGSLSSFEFDATDCPDLFPPLVALAAYCKGETRIKGVSRLAHKESDRALTLQEEFGKMGVRIELNGDVMTIQGGGELKQADVHSRHDHRIAMACAVAALKSSGHAVIHEAEAINKSYPDFYAHLQEAGAELIISP